MHSHQARSLVPSPDIPWIICLVKNKAFLIPLSILSDPRFPWLRDRLQLLCFYTLGAGSEDITQRLRDGQWSKYNYDTPH